MTITSFRRDKS